MVGACAEENMGEDEEGDGGRYDHMLLCTYMELARKFERNLEP